MKLKTIIIAWIPMPFMGVANGVLRQALMLNYMDDFKAHQLSSVTLAIFLTIYVMAIFKRLHIESHNAAMFIAATTAIRYRSFGLSFERILSKQYKLLGTDEQNVRESRITLEWTLPKRR